MQNYNHTAAPLAQISELDDPNYPDSLLSPATRQALHELIRLQVAAKALEKRYEQFLQTHQVTLGSQEKSLTLTNDIEESFGNVTFINYEISEQLIRADLDRPGR